MEKPKFTVRLLRDWFFFRSWVIYKDSEKERGFLRDTEGKRLVIVKRSKLKGVLRSLKRSSPDAIWTPLPFRDYLLHIHAAEEGVKLGPKK